MRDIFLYVKDIISAIEDIQAFAAGMKFEEFVGDKKTSMAVIRELEIIGEAAKGIPDPVRVQHPDIPWKQMSGMRDRLIHAYFQIDYQLVWRTIQETLPKLLAPLKSLLDQVESKKSC